MMFLVNYRGKDMHFEWKEVLFLIVFVLIFFSFVIPNIWKALKRPIKILVKAIKN